jgi:hypothetical protein
MKSQNNSWNFKVFKIDFKKFWNDQYSKPNTCDNPVHERMNCWMFGVIKVFRVGGVVDGIILCFVEKNPQGVQ